MGKYDDRPYGVGKGKPPRQHSYKKGESGNPSGAKKGKRRLRQPLREQLIKAGSVVVEVPTPNGPRKMTRNQLGIELLYNDLIHGTPAERLRAFKELRMHGAFDALPADYLPSPESRTKSLEELAENARRQEEERAKSDRGPKP